MSKYVGNILTDGAATGYSCGFNGSSTYLSVANNSAFALTGDFTIEFWAYLPSVSSAYGFIGYGTTTSGWNLINDDSRWVFKMMNGSDNNVFVQDGTATTNSWQHYAITSSSGTVKFFINGSQVATGTAVSSTPASGSLTIGYGYSTSYALPSGSFLSNVRIVKGTAVYTAAFTPPTQLFPILNTSLLTCQQPTIIDTSSNAFAITNTGGVTVSNFSPFPAYQAYNPASGAGTPGIWSLNDAAYAAQNQSWNMYDPYWKNTTLLLNGESAANGAQNNTFLDSSTNNFTITRNGNTTQGSFSPYGNLWSNYFDGSGDYISVPDNAAFDVGSGEFTIECWLNPSSTPSSGQYFCGQADAGTSTGSVSVFMYRTNTGTIVGRFQATDAEYYGNASTATAPVGVWTHVAYVRDGNTTRLYINGVQSATTDVTGKTVTNSSTIFAVGAVGLLATIQYNGYISNFRFQKGVCQYPSGTTFTPSTTPLTAVSGTSLLTCQSNRFIDNSSNNFAITVNGNTSVQRFSPFNPTAPYSASTIGGSGYFGGQAAPNTDRLSIANTSQLDFGTGDFTIECWVYGTTAWSSYAAEFAQILGKGNALSSGAYSLAGYQSKLYFTGTQGSITLPANAWCHLAVTRSSGTLRLFVNGVLDTSASNSTDFTIAQSFNIGDRIASDPSAQYPFNGYISNVRIVKGTALYTSTFTPSTTPLTAVSGTSLLCNMTNAGIPDAAMQNDLETVGNAQVSTSVKKYGTGSLAFDGTGDYLVAPSNPALTTGTGDFTIEAWVYSAVSGPIVIDGASGSIVSMYISNGGGNRAIIGAANYPTSGVSVIITTSTSVSANTWTHVALVRSSGTLTVYINGTSGGTSANTANSYEQRTIGSVIQAGTPLLPFNGYIDDLRITKGIARYTANFTPPTSSLQNL